MGLPMGLREQSIGVRDVCVERDLLVVFGWGLGQGNGSWKYAFGP